MSPIVTHHEGIHRHETFLDVDTLGHDFCLFEDCVIKLTGQLPEGARFSAMGIPYDGLRRTFRRCQFVNAPEATD